MSQREKNILVFLVLVVLGAGVYLLFFNNEEESVEDMVDMAALQLAVTNVQTMTSSNVLNGSELGKLRMAESPWRSDPFYKFSGETSPILETDTRNQYRFTGFADFLGVRYAIINGWEYGVNDQLEDGSYFVLEIHHDRVVLAQRDNAGEIAGKLEVELEQDEQIYVDHGAPNPPGQ